MSVSYSWSSKMPTLHISLLGHIVIELDGQPIDKVPTQKVAALFAYLVSNPGTHRREHLADLLWDDIPHNRFLPNLRSTLNRLPKIFKPYLVTTRETITFEIPDNVERDIWVDVLAFQTLADRLPNMESGQSDDYISQLSAIEEQLVAMLGHYKGAFLGGLLLNDAPRFSDWQFIQREYLADLALDGLRCLVELTMHQGRYGDGIAYARQMTELDPLDEEVHCQLMIMLARSGDEQAALQVYQALVEMLDEEFGAPPSPETVAAYEQITAVDQPDQWTPATLPTFIQPSIGRQAEIAKLIHQLQMNDCRLVTVTGLGGMGKTYLAVEAARMIEKNKYFQHGVVYIRFTGEQSADRFTEEIAQALDLILADRPDQLSQLCDYLKSKEILFILDDMEHLLDAPNSQSKAGAGDPYGSQRTAQNGTRFVGNVLSQILQSAPQVKFLVTSRQPLRVQLEYLYPLSGMKHPPTDSSLSDLMQIDAIRLFHQVAWRMNRAFELTADNRQAVIQFCTLMQGTPLAIVLGAAQMDFLTPEELVDACEDGLDILQTEWANLPARQRSIHTVFEHSWQRLDEPLRLVLQKLTVFRGSFTNQAARQIAGASIRQLKQLYNQSLLLDSAQGRYEIHALLRQFSIEKAAEHGEQSPDWLAAVWDRHMEFYLHYISQKVDGLQGSKPFDTIAEIDPDLNNIRQAWQHAMEQRKLSLLAESRKGLVALYRLQGLYQDALALFTQAAQTLQPYIKPPPTFEAPTLGDSEKTSISYLEIYSALLTTQGFFHLQVGEPEQAIQKAEMAIGYAQWIDELCIEKECIYSVPYETQAFGYWVWARALSMLGNDQHASTQVNQALYLAQRAVDKTLIADSFHLRGNIHFLLDQREAAIEDFQQARALYIQAGDRHKEIDCLDRLGSILDWSKELAVARGYFEQALAISNEIHDELNRHRAILNSCRIASLMGEYIHAERGGQEVLRYYLDIGDRWMATEAHFFLGTLYNKLGLYNDARYHQDQALQLSRVMNARHNQLICLRELGITYGYLGSHQEALTLLEEAQKIAAELNMKSATISIYTAHMLSERGRIREGIDLYQEALAFCQSHDLVSLEMETLARLANVLQRSGDVAAAARSIEDVQLYWEKISAEKSENNEGVSPYFDDPFAFYLNCYCVLDACEDSRALLLLEAGYRLLQTYASRIDDEVWRKSFLESVAVNQEIVRLWEDEEMAEV